MWCKLCGVNNGATFGHWKKVIFAVSRKIVYNCFITPDCLFHTINNRWLFQLLTTLHNRLRRSDFWLSVSLSQTRCWHWAFALALRALLHWQIEWGDLSPASHGHIIGQVIARCKECIQFVFESTTASLRNCLLKEANFREFRKSLFSNVQK